MKKSAAMPAAGEFPLQRLLLLLLWGAALLWRISYLLAGFTYDEFWSLLNFSGLAWGRILTDLSLPNNHPVNTLVLKLVSAVSDNFAIMRLPALAAGIAVVVLTGTLLSRWSRDDFAGNLAQVLALFSLPLVIVSTRCRGYVWQLLFWELTLWGLTEFAGCGRERERRCLLLTAVSALLCCLSVSTGILLLVPAGMAFLLTAPPEKKKRPELWLAGGVTGGVLLWYYCSNFAALNSGRTWGTAIGGIGDYFSFLFRGLPAYLPAAAVIAGVWALIKVPLSRKIAAAALFPLLAAVFTGGGPARVYIYLAPAVCWLAALGLAELRRYLPAGRQVIILTAAVLVPLSYVQPVAGEFTPPDYPALWAGRGDKTAIAVVPATAGYPIRCTFWEKAPRETAAALAVPEPQTLLLLENVIRGSDEQHCERAVTLKSSGKPGADGWRRYRLVRTPQAVSGRDYLVRARNRRDGLAVLQKQGAALTLNEWLLAGEGEYSLWYFRPEKTVSLPENLELFEVVTPER